MDCAINQLGQMECNYMDRLRKIAPLLSDKEILDSVVANTQNAADMGKTMQNEGASNLGIFNQPEPEVQAPSAQDLSQFMVPEAPTAQDFAQFMEPEAPTAQDFAQFMKPRPRDKFNQPSTQPQAPKAQDSAQSIELKSKLLLDLFKKMGGGFRRTTVSVVNEVRDLLNSGANPNIKDEYGHPLLHNAVLQSEYKENHEIVKLLLKAGAEPNMYDDHGDTIFGSMQTTDVKTFKLLLESGANPNLPSMWGSKVRKYPIHMVLSGEYVDPDDDFYKNRLEFKEKKLESLGLLLQYGADPTNKDSDGRNALEYARYNYDTYGPENGHFLEEVELIEEYIERMNRKKIGKVSVKEGRVFTQAGLGRRRSRKKKKSKNKKLKKGGKRSNKKSGKTLKNRKRK